MSNLNLWRVLLAAAVLLAIFMLAARLGVIR